MHVVLVNPEIPQNTGNIARTCAATGLTLHLVKPLGFQLDDKYMKRAGLDYWFLADVRVHESWEDFLRENPGANCYFATTRAPRDYCQVQYGPEDFLVFGCETRGAARIAAKAGVRSLRAHSHAAGRALAEPGQFGGRRGV